MNAFYSLDLNTSFPDFQNYLLIFPKESQFGEMWRKSVANYKSSLIESIAEQNRKHSLYLFLFTLLHPISKGNITLKSSNPKDPPLINANYFDDPRDLEMSVKGIKRLNEIVNTKYFKSIDAYLGRMRWPACDKFTLDRDEYWRCICINMPISVYHPVGTAKMEPDPSTSVVDSRLRVHGMKGLRVVDASVMPTITSTNTNDPMIMIGERGSDLIKYDYLMK